MPPPAASFPISLNGPPLHVEVTPGGEIILRGSFHSTHDGSTVDAATTQWPAEAPGGASVDSGGLVDFEAGGFHMTSRDPKTHEVHAIATGDVGQACAATGVASPCLPLRLRTQSLSRDMLANDWAQSLKGAIQVEVLAPPFIAPPPVAVPYLQAGAAALGLALVGIVAYRFQKRRAESPAAKLAALTKRVREKLAKADPVLAAPLAPALETALRVLRERRVDPSSREGKRVEAVLLRVDARLDESRKHLEAAEEQAAADELVREMEAALEAGDETSFRV